MKNKTRRIATLFLAALLLITFIPQFSMVLLG